MKIKELYEKVNDGKIISDIELQREIIYDIYKQKLVIDSIAKEIPLPAFYFWKNENGILEVLDGKQRIEAIRKFYQNDIEYEGKLWKECSSEFQEIVNETNISDIVCSGTEELKREIFFRINTLGEPLSRYVKANKDRSFENDQRIVIKPIKFIASVFEKYTEIDILFFRLIPNAYFLPKKNNNFYSNKPQKTTNIAVLVVSNYLLKPNSK